MKLTRTLWSPSTAACSCPDDGLRLLARHPALEVGVLGVVGTAPQGGQGDAEEGVALFRRHLSDAVEVTEAGGDKVEVLGVLV